ncbi:MAG TPA: response regulator [Bryobacteraceae bacterium]|jgi:DNA-binding response OmpR family regulator|nr:response regulator [Bryobacteraceae bacterium]
MLFSPWARLKKSAILNRLTKAAAKMHGPRKWRTLNPSALIVDDDPDIHPLVKAALNHYAVTSESVHDGTAALARLKAHRYDLVILDLGLAELNGFDILRALKTQERLKEIPVIVLTANGSEESLARSFGYGADDFVAKPFKASELGMRAYRLLYPLKAQ